MCTFTNDFIYQLFSKFHKNPHLSRNEPGFWLILFWCPAVKRSHWRKFFPHRPLVLEQQLDLLPKVPTGHTMVFGWPIEYQRILVRFWHRPSYLVYVFVNQVLHGIRASQCICSNAAIIHLLRKKFKSFRLTLRLVGFFPTRCSLYMAYSYHSTFTKHELLFVLSLYSKYCHTS